MIDNLTAMLCEACGMIEGRQTTMSGPLRKWWEDHKKADAARRAEKREQEVLRGIAKKTIGKLTPAEKEALAFIGVKFPKGV